MSASSNRPKRRSRAPCLRKVANFDDRNTIARSDDVITAVQAAAHSRGRAKPDRAAPGTLIRSVAHDSSRFVELTGASMAAPHVAGAASNTPFVIPVALRSRRHRRAPGQSPDNQSHTERCAVPAADTILFRRCAGNVWFTGGRRRAGRPGHGGMAGSNGAVQRTGGGSRWRRRQLVLQFNSSLSLAGTPMPQKPALGE